MSTYRRAWRTLVGILTGVGIVLAGTRATWPLLLEVGGSSALLGAGFGLLAYVSSPAPRTAKRHLFVPSVLTSLSVVAAIGYLMRVGPAVPFGVGLLLLCSPWGLEMLLARGPRAAPDTGSASFCRDLSNAELCERWRSSSAALRSAASPDERLSCVRARSVLLDELARRDPKGVSRWLREGAGADR